MHLGCRAPSPQQRVLAIQHAWQQPPLPLARRPGLQPRARLLLSPPAPLLPPCRASRQAPQPLADVALGGGRLASQLVNSITNPKEDKELAKKRQKWQQQQDADKARQQREAAEAEAAAAAEAGAEAAQQLVDPLALPLAAAAGDQQQQQQLEGGAAAAPAEAAAAAMTAQQAAAAVAAAGAGQQQPAVVSEYYSEEVEVAPVSLAQRAVDARAWLAGTATGKGVSIAAGLFLGATLLIALYRTWQKYSSPRAQRMRVIDKNKLLVEELSKHLPGRRSELTPGVMRRLRGATGFTPVEVFRKYLWFLLRERQFDADAVEDMALLKGALGLSDEEVAEALRERAARIYDKYGTLMLNTEGMTAEGLERKATCRALFSKLLYLTEHEPLLAQGSEAFKTADLRRVFGATDEDVDKLRIVSLYTFDVDKMESLVAGGGSSSTGGQEGGGGGGGGDSDSAAQSAAAEPDSSSSGGGSSSSQPQEGGSGGNRAGDA